MKMFPKLHRFGVFLAGLCVAGVSVQAANFNWVAATPTDYNVPMAWDRLSVPNASITNTATVANGGTVNVASSDNILVGQLNLAPSNYTSAAFSINGGAVVITNLNILIPLFLGGYGVGTWTQPSTGYGSVANLTVNGGSLTVARNNGFAFYQDGVDLGVCTNGSGTLTVNNGVVTLLCGMEIGVYGSGTVNMAGGVLVDNSWFGIGRGSSGPNGSGTVNLTGGSLYLVRNSSTEANTTHGFYFCVAGTNGVANLSGGSLYCNRIAFANNGLAREVLNISGGSLYVGSEGVSASSAQPIVTISGGVFHTVDMVLNGTVITLNGNPYTVGNGDTNSVLSDGTNWTWSSQPSVNLVSTIPGLGGVGYVTFAPESGRTITLDNTWTGNGGLVVNGPGSVIVAASNSYAGSTTINQGTLMVAQGGSLASSNIIVTSAGTFAGPPSGASYTLPAGQVLTNNGSMATLSGYINSGAGTVSLSYAAGAPAFTVSGGTLGLAPATQFIVNNTGPALAAGSYEIIAAGSGGAVGAQGGLPGVTVGGNGVAAGQYAYLSLAGNNLYLTISASHPPVVAHTVTNILFYGSTWQIAISNLAALAGWSDPQGQAVGLSGVGPSSADGTNVYSDGTNIYYNGILSGSDYFNYTITNSALSAAGSVYLTEIEPTAATPVEASNVVSLNGSWRFYFERSNYNLGTPPSVSLPPDSEPFQMTNYVEGPGWSNLVVPGNWEMAGFSPATYFVPDDTCGLYRDWIQVPSSWRGRRVYLALDGVLDGAEVWLNGQPVPVNEPSWNIVNYHESGWTGFQVDLTSQIQFGTSNLLAVRVIKSTPSDDLDTGDYFVLGGIYRNVTLYSVPQTNFADVQVQTTLLGNNAAQVQVTADITGGNAQTPVSMFLNGVETDQMATNGQVVFTQTISQPRLWSCEFPNLYPLTLELKDGNGNVTETVTNRVGIRQITISNGVLSINGAPVKFAGICDHDSSVTNGSAVTADFWRNEILAMKAANINAVRTTHYPFDQAFYDTCDELGMYVSDELPYCWCDNETPEASMQPAFEQRARETIRRDRNHPSVVIWAIGNENTAGNNLQVVANLIASEDATRPRLVSTFNATQYGVELSDAHYPSIANMQSDAANAQSSGHPYIFLENPNTWDERLAADNGMYEDWGLCMQRVWNVCQQYSTVCGTFPFEWSDRAVQDPNANSSYLEYQSTGVQLLYYFPATGIHLLKKKGAVDAFRNERPSVYEMQMIYSPIQISGSLTEGTGQVSFPVQNRYSFTDLTNLTTAWELERNGLVLAGGTTNASLPPLSTGSVQLSMPSNALAYADTLRLDFIDVNGNDILPYQFVLTNLTVTSQLSTNLPANLPIPALNLIAYNNYTDPGLWTACARYPAVLTNIVLTPSGATTLGQMKALNGTVVSSNGQILGSLHAGYTNATFSYTLNWSGPTTNIQELGWSFQMPSNYTQFSWNRIGRWTFYPQGDISRASGTATPDSTNVDGTDWDITNAFDFNSTKYNCNWASLTSPAGDGVRLGFGSQLFHCKAGAATNGTGYVLIANQEASPASDISSNVVPDLFLTLYNGSVVQGSFTVGSNTNLPPAAQGSLGGPIAVWVAGGGQSSQNPVEISFNGYTNTSYSVWASTNLMQWQWEGAAMQGNPGQYEFTDSSASNFPARYYRISSP